MLEVLSATVIRGSKAILEEVTFSVARGEALLINGQVGAGKTTLLRAIAGLEQVDHGDVMCDGVSWSRSRWTPPWQRSVAMLFQDLTLWPGLSGIDQLAHVLPFGRSESWRVRRGAAQRMLALWGLDVLAPKQPDQMSGGQQQQLALLRALMRRTRVLLLDEPIAHLDAERKLQTLQRLRDLKVQDGLCIVIASHQGIDGLADRTAELRAGRLTCT